MKEIKKEINKAIKKLKEQYDVYYEEILSRDVSEEFDAGFIGGMKYSLTILEKVNKNK